jgi:hypothetical protein
MKPQWPGESFPLVWQAPDYGYYGLRNGWKGKDDFLVQLFARTKTPRIYSLPNAGALTIMGLGHVWAKEQSSNRLHNRRIFSNVVQLPEDDHFESGLGTVTHASFDEDGSGSITINLDDVYARKSEDRGGARAYEKYGSLRHPEGLAKTGITGLRAIGVDYSGRSGAPCLFVVVDRIDGGKDKLWQWYLKDEVVDKRGKVLETSDLKRAKADGNTATVTKDDGASMKLTFVSPGTIDVRVQDSNVNFRKTYNRGIGAFRWPTIYAQGDNPRDGHFFVVGTIQKGQAPKIDVQGKGLDAIVTVGKQTVRFDGEKILFGSPGRHTKR